jgi:hypothetical protein
MKIAPSIFDIMLFVDHALPKLESRKFIDALYYGAHLSRHVVNALDDNHPLMLN